MADDLVVTTVAPDFDGGVADPIGDWVAGFSPAPGPEGSGGSGDHTYEDATLALRRGVELKFSPQRVKLYPPG